MSHFRIVYHSHADAEEERDDGVTAVRDPRECIALGVPENVVQERPFSRPLLAGEKNTPRLDVREEFSEKACEAAELKLDFDKLPFRADIFLLPHKLYNFLQYPRLGPHRGRIKFAKDTLSEALSSRMLRVQMTD